MGKLRARNVSHRKHRHGLTLLDLVLAVLILGIVAAVAAPRVTRTWSRLKLDSAAQRLTSQLNHARRLAASRSQPLRMTFVSNPPKFEARDATTSALVASYSFGSDVAGSTLLASFNGQSAVTLDIYGQPATAGSVQLTAGTYSRSITSNVQSQWAFVLQ